MVVYAKQLILGNGMAGQRRHNKDLFRLIRSDSENYFHGNIEGYIREIMEKDEKNLTRIEMQIKQAVLYGTELAKQKINELIKEKLKEPAFILKISVVVFSLVGIGFLLGKKL